MRQTKEKNNALKKKKREALIEGLLELIATLFFYGVGVVIIGLLIPHIDFAAMDGDLLVLIGIAVIFLPLGTLLSLIEKIKKKAKKKKEKSQEQDLDI